MKIVEGSSTGPTKQASKEVHKSTAANVVSISRASNSDFKRAVGSDVSGDEWDKM